GFVEAANAAMRQRPELRFLMVGRDVTPQNQALSNRIAAGGHPERFLLLGERSDVADCLSAMDAFCLHSHTEGFPNVLGEAMCVGLPCLATDVGDAGRLLGDAGRIIPAGDSGRLAQAMVQLAGLGETESHALGARSRQRIAEHFTLGHSVGRFEALYRAAASSSADPEVNRWHWKHLS